MNSIVSILGVIYRYFYLAYSYLHSYLFGENIDIAAALDKAFTDDFTIPKGPEEIESGIVTKPQLKQESSVEDELVKEMRKNVENIIAQKAESSPESSPDYRMRKDSSNNSFEIIDPIATMV